jgi:hypothetical protein
VRQWDSCTVEYKLVLLESEVTNLRYMQCKLISDRLSCAEELGIIIRIYPTSAMNIFHCMI